MRNLICALSLSIPIAALADNAEWLRPVQAAFAGAKIYAAPEKTNAFYYGEMVCFGDGGTFPVGAALVKDAKGKYKWLNAQTSLIFTAYYVDPRDPAIKRGQHTFCKELPNFLELHGQAENLYR